MSGQKLGGHPQVPVPAPLIVLFFVLLAEFVEVHLPLVVNHPTLFYLGWSAILLASVVMLWCFLLFYRARTTIMPANPVKRLVLSGPYRYSRNPMYLALALFHVGYATATGNPWGWITLLPALAMIEFMVIRPEERYLRRQFGNDYEVYATKVRRWI